VGKFREPLQQLSAALLKLVRIILGLAFLGVCLAMVVWVLTLVADYWSGRFDRACTGQFAKYESVDNCLHTSKCSVSADELKIKDDFESQCTVDFVYDKEHDKVNPVVKAVPRKTPGVTP
jgi:hypothetical protein